MTSPDDVSTRFRCVTETMRARFSFFLGNTSGSISNLSSPAGLGGRSLDGDGEGPVVGTVDGMDEGTSDGTSEGTPEETWDGIDEG